MSAAARHVSLFGRLPASCPSALSADRSPICSTGPRSDRHRRAVMWRSDRRSVSIACQARIVDTSIAPVS